MLPQQQEKISEAQTNAQNFLAIPAETASDAIWQNFYAALERYYDTNNPQVAACIKTAEKRHFATR